MIFEQEAQYIFQGLYPKALPGSRNRNPGNSGKNYRTDQ